MTRACLVRTEDKLASETGHHRDPAPLIYCTRLGVAVVVVVVAAAVSRSRLKHQRVGAAPNVFAANAAAAGAAGAAVAYSSCAVLHGALDF